MSVLYGKCEALCITDKKLYNVMVQQLRVTPEERGFRKPKSLEFFSFKQGEKVEVQWLTYQYTNRQQVTDMRTHTYTHQ